MAIHEGYIFRLNQSLAEKVHDNVQIKKANGGEKVSPSPEGLKLQEHGQDVRYRNVWIAERN